MDFDDCKLETTNNNFKVLCNKVEELENKLKEYREIEKEQKDVKAKLKKAMEENNVKSWKTLNGTIITLIADTPDEEYIENEFDIEKFKEENEELYNKYVVEKEKIKLGRSGYIKIALPKE